MERKHNSLMFISFLAYYIILFAERVTSFVLSATDPAIGVGRMFFRSGFNFFVYGITLFSLFVSLILFLRIVGKAMSVGIAGSSKLLIINAGVLLVSGMQETLHTYTVVQFIAYIFLFIGCFTKFIEIKNKKDAAASTFASFVYFVGFGFAIPVVHRVTGSTDAIGVKNYYYFEEIAALLLCVVFTIIMLFLFSEERYRHVNNVTFFALLAAADAVVLIQGFGIGAPNYFMAGALGVAAIAYLVTVILLFRDKRAKIL